MLATSGQDSTILLWDLAVGSLGVDSKAAPLTTKDLDALWSDLAGDGAKADRAIWTLALAPQHSLPLVKARLDVAAAPAEQVNKLISELDSESFATRQTAKQTLEAMGAAAEAALRKVLQGNPPLEVRQRVGQILEKRDQELLRILRAIEALELMGTTEAQQVLQRLAKRSPNPRVAQAASAAVRRLAQRA